jgi:hypothetical protein
MIKESDLLANRLSSFRLQGLFICRRPQVFPDHRLQIIDPIELQYSLFLVLGFDHEIHIVRQASGKFGAPVRVGAEFHGSHGTRAGLRVVLLGPDPTCLPGLVNKRDKLGGWAARGLKIC